jgi:hypothetical protein
MSPVCCPIFGNPCHSSSVESFIRKMEITRVVIFVVKRKAVHDICLGRGKVRLKRVSKSLSVLQAHLCTLPNEHDGMLVRGFLTPGMCTVVIGHVFFTFSRNAKAHTSFAAILDFLDAIFSIQLIIGKLSLNKATCLCAMSHTMALTQSHSNSRPTISRLELSSVPCGLSDVINCALISLGHSRQKTVGGISDSSPITMPPTRWLDASTIPT